MLRKQIRKIIRRMGYDGCELRRFDNIEVSTLSWSGFHKTVETLFFSLERTKTPLVVMQLGANDTEKDDLFGFFRSPDRQHRLILVEPNPFCVQKLQERFSGYSNVTIVPKAFAERSGRMSFYYFREKYERGIQLDVFSTLIREQIEQKKKDLDISSIIEETAIEAAPLSELVASCDLAGVDVMLCDIEGYDGRLVSDICRPDGVRPSLLVYEHAWLPTSERRAGYEKLMRNGYQLVCGESDSLAYFPPAFGIRPNSSLKAPQLEKF